MVVVIAGTPFLRNRLEAGFEVVKWSRKSLSMGKELQAIASLFFTCVVYLNLEVSKLHQDTGY
jgi:hypothetical protein